MPTPLRWCPLKDDGDKLPQVVVTPADSGFRSEQILDERALDGRIGGVQLECRADVLGARCFVLLQVDAFHGVGRPVMRAQPGHSSSSSDIGASMGSLPTWLLRRNPEPAMEKGFGLDEKWCLRRSSPGRGRGTALGNRVRLAGSGRLAL